MKLENLAGVRFDRLVVTTRDIGKKPTRWICQCDCGNTTSATAANLKYGAIRSCGCLQRELASKRLTTHGKSAVPEYQSWAGMNSRCHDAPIPGYGGRGIYVCERWRASVEDFILDMGRKPSPRHSIDRINNDGSYTCGRHDVCADCREKNAPANCRWATRVEQQRNTSRNHFVDFDGRTMTIAEMSEISGVSSGVLAKRIARNLTPEEAVDPKPVNGSVHRHNRGLSLDDVREIRRRLAAGETRASVAAAFNVNRNSIRRIELGLRWKGVL